MALTLSVKASVVADYTKVLDLATANAPIAKAFALAFADGAGASQASKIFHDTRTVAASATDSLDLAGVLTDIYGAAFTLTKLKGVFVVSSAANVGANQLRIMRPASSGAPLFGAAGDFIALDAGGVFLWSVPSAGGVTVTASTGDLLDLVNSAGTNTITYDIVIWGD